MWIFRTTPIEECNETSPLLTMRPTSTEGHTFSQQSCQAPSRSKMSKGDRVRKFWKETREEFGRGVKLVTDTDDESAQIQVSLAVPFGSYALARTTAESRTARFVRWVQERYPKFTDHSATAGADTFGSHSRPKPSTPGASRTCLLYMASRRDRHHFQNRPGSSRCRGGSATSSLSRLGTLTSGSPYVVVFVGTEAGRGGKRIG
ncbi:hypothetical protein DB88DRAFT_547970 [Papiliotrema laurentii]|uniref:Uncharacterized protein n=1 Tax=Papiliotrema laurentii TaxID=5418 RepID=A0AAD9CVJ4_PAPLA|nr:hypothetical protein DB88DRAFT_547970 [Papiliotrema laurentii]